jgi:hypothetical protein
MTPQSSDSILIDGRKYRLYTYPLDYYWNKKNPKPPMRWPTTACYRGYIAKWEIVDNFLYLIDLTYRAVDQDEGLEYVFPNITGKIKASWYSGELRIPLGDPLIPPGFTHYDFYIVPTETDWFIRIKKGQVIKQRYKANY